MYIENHPGSEGSDIIYNNQTGGHYHAIHEDQNGTLYHGDLEKEEKNEVDMMEVRLQDMDEIKRSHYHGYGIHRYEHTHSVDGGHA